MTQKCHKYFCQSLNLYVLSADVSFYENPLGHSTSNSPLSINEYDYLILQGTLVNSGDSASDNVIVKI